MDDCGYCTTDIDSTELLFCSDVKNVYFTPNTGNLDGGQMITLTSDCFGNNDKLLVTCNFDTISVKARFWNVNQYVCLAPTLLKYHTLVFDFSVTLGFRAFSNALSENEDGTDNQFTYVVACGAKDRKNYNTISFNQSVTNMKPGSNYDIVWDPSKFGNCFFYFNFLCFFFVFFFLFFVFVIIFEKQI